MAVGTGAGDGVGVGVAVGTGVGDGATVGAVVGTGVVGGSGVYSDGRVFTFIVLLVPETFPEASRARTRKE